MWPSSSIINNQAVPVILKILLLFCSVDQLIMWIVSRDGIRAVLNIKTV